MLTKQYLQTGNNLFSHSAAATFTMTEGNYCLIMLHQQERTALLLIIGVLILLAVSSFLIESTGKESFAAPFSETLEDGTLAVLSGSVTAAANTKTGGHLILGINNTSVFVPNGALDDPKTAIGEKISVTGTVQTYHGKKEMIVGCPDDITIWPQ